MRAVSGAHIIGTLALAALAALKLIRGSFLGGAPFRIPESMLPDLGILLLPAVASQLLRTHAHQGLQHAISWFSDTQR